MILVNNIPLNLTSFPDGTSSFRLDASQSFSFVKNGRRTYYIEWRYDSENECISLWYLTKHIKSFDGNAEVLLYLPYAPNARMDRVKNSDEVFTLKWFADFINTLCFDKVVVCDPHSNVTTALINNIELVNVKSIIEGVLDELNHELHMDVLCCYPDEGAAKRYSNEIKTDYVFCIKHRDWRTGKIERLELTNPVKVNGRNVLIVDDICSKGGTFTYTAKALKDAGANEIFLYITHCENTIEKGSVLTDGLISRVFTTNSIYRGNTDKITVINNTRGETND